MTRTGLITLGLVGSLSLLAGAFLFQFAGYSPCELCLWQRWPHGVAAAIGIFALAAGHRAARNWALLGALSMMVATGLAIFHSGIERRLWDGLPGCTSGAGIGGDLLSLDGPMIAPCDAISWQLAGLSMANYNAIFSAVLLLIWVAAARRP